MVTLLLGLSLSGTLLRAQSPASLKAITFQKTDGKLAVLAAIEGAFSPEFQLLSQPSRLLVDLAGVESIQAAPYTQIDDMGILAVRTGQFKAQTARIVFDLGGKVPAYSFSVAPEGLKILFWLSGEEAAQPVSEPVREPSRPVIREERRREAAPARDAAVEGPTGVFGEIKGGTAIFLTGNQDAVPREFTLYGETATINESYSWKPGLTVDAALGAYLRAFGSTIKAGLGFSYQTYGGEGTLIATLPHPFEVNAPRQVTAEQTEGLDSKSMNIFAFGLFSLVRSEKLSLWAGPLAGVALGTLATIEDFDFEDQINTVILAGTTVIEEKYTTPLFGALLSAEYHLNEALSIVFDAKAVYINPKSENLGKRINLLQFQPVLGLQYRF